MLMPLNPWYFLLILPVWYQCCKEPSPWSLYHRPLHLPLLHHRLLLTNINHIRRLILPITLVVSRISPVSGFSASITGRATAWANCFGFVNLGTMTAHNAIIQIPAIMIFFFIFSLILSPRSKKRCFSH